MSLFDILEGRMQQIFEGGSSMAPLPFKKLAKRAVREMKHCAVKMDGQTFAPSLYTILVNPADDAVIAPLYQQVTDELVDFVAHEAQNDGLALIANPMVRFIADPNIKPGKTEVVAEVITPDVLESLRVEEAAYAQNHMAGNRPGMRGARPGMRPNGARPAAGQPQDGRELAPSPVPGGAPRGANRPMGAPAPTPAPNGASPAGVPAGSPSPDRTPSARPASSGRRPAAGASGSCELVDTRTGRTWRIGVASTVIGRDEATADLALDDTNVSRRHAELKRENGRWSIADLGSTNGTRVNGMRVTEQPLSSGDTITLGLITLKFREL